MLADLSIEKLFGLALIGLFVVGPERLPSAVSWVAGPAPSDPGAT